jgi:predicted NAD-dependent protein-ADP-ribosyltransferase YbiA (DUF1768 family)
MTVSAADARTVDDVTYQSAEHFMMAAKAMLFDSSPTHFLQEVE